MFENCCSAGHCFAKLLHSFSAPMALWQHCYSCLFWLAENQKGLLTFVHQVSLEARAVFAITLGVSKLPVCMKACDAGRIAEDSLNCAMISKESGAVQQLILMALSDNEVVVEQACKTLCKPWYLQCLQTACICPKTMQAVFCKPHSMWKHTIPS